MAKSKKSKGSATTRGKARKAKAHVKAKRAARVTKKQARRAEPIIRDNASNALGMTAGINSHREVSEAISEGVKAEHFATGSETDSGLEPSEEKEILNALDADYNEDDEEGDRDGEDDEA